MLCQDRTFAGKKQGSFTRSTSLIGLKVYSCLALVTFTSLAQSKDICLFVCYLFVFLPHVNVHFVCFISEKDKVLKVMCFPVMPTTKAQD